MEGLAVGRIVHYVEHGEHLAAVVTQVPPLGVWPSLTVFRPGGEILGVEAVRFDDTEKREGTWHWPERA